MRPETLDRHVDDLCTHHGIRRVAGSGRAVVLRVRARDGTTARRLEIRVPPVRGQVSYFIALHEIGHLVGAGRSGRRLEQEAAAWRFALTEALVAPTDATRRRIGKRLRSYVTWAELRARRRRPPYLPPDDDPFWGLLAWLESELSGREMQALYEVLTDSRQFPDTRRIKRGHPIGRLRRITE